MQLWKEFSYHPGFSYRSLTTPADISVIDCRVHQVNPAGRSLDHLGHLGHRLLYQHWLEVHLAYLAHRDLQDCLVTDNQLRYTYYIVHNDV